MDCSPRLTDSAGTGRVVIVTDSSATVPADLVEALDIRVVSIYLVLDGHTFRDGVHITATEVYRWLRESKRLPPRAMRGLPTTSVPSVGGFLRVYTTAAQEASGIASTHLSPKLSATYNSATAASQLVDGSDGHPHHAICNLPPACTHLRLLSSFANSAEPWYTGFIRTQHGGTRQRARKAESPGGHGERNPPARVNRRGGSRFTWQCAHFLLGNGVHAISVACGE